MQKKTNNIKWKLLFCGCLLFLVLMVMVNIKDYRADKNRCVNILIESDEIANGCDKYFLNDKWYKDYMKHIYKEYNKIK